MPILPNPDEIPRQRLQPSTGIVRVEAGQVGQAMQQAGYLVERTADRVQNFADQTAALHAQDALVALKRQKNQMTVGQDGYATLQNAAATQPGVFKKYQDRFDEAATGIAAGLSPMARQKFESAARGMKNEFEAGFLSHALREDLNHRGEVYKARIQVAAETMGINYNNPEALLREKTNIDRTVAQYVADNGIKDEAVIERMLQDARGTGHEQVVNAYINEGSANSANSYFEAVKDQMLPEKAQALRNMLKPEMANQVGRDISGKLFQMHMEGRPENEIFEEKLRLTEGKSIEAIRATDMLYDDRVRALDKDRSRQGGAILIRAWNGENVMSDPQLRQIDSTDPVFGAQLRSQIHTIQRREAAAAKGDASARMPDEISTANYGLLYDAIRNGDLVDDGEIAHQAALAGLNKSDMKSLLSLNKERGNKSASFKISTELINAGIPKSARGNKEKTDAYKGFVMRSLQDWKAQNPNKTPTPEEQRAIVNSASEEHIEVGRFWNSKSEAYQAEGKTTYPRAFGLKLPGYSEDEILEAYSAVQQARAAMDKNDRNYTDAELIEVWKMSKGQKR